MEKDYQETITNLVCECKLLEQQLKKKDEVIKRAVEVLSLCNSKCSKEVTQILEDKEVE